MDARSSSTVMEQAGEMQDGLGGRGLNPLFYRLEGLRVRTVEIRVARVSHRDPRVVRDESRCILPMLAFESDRATPRDRVHGHVKG